MNLSRNDVSLDIQTPHSQSREKETPTHTTGDEFTMVSLSTIFPSHNTIREMRIQRRTRENGVSTIKVLDTTSMNDTPRSPSCPS
jgi:hypothetical protein